MVRMSLQGDVKLDALVGYISQRLGVNLEYDDQIAARTVTIRTPGEIPVASLPLLLGSVLRTEQLALVDSDNPGWKRIVDIKDVARFAAPGEAVEVLDRNGPASVVTQVLLLKNLNAASLGEVLKAFVSGPGATLSAIPEVNALIVTDYATSVKTMSDLIELIDRPPGEGDYQLYESKYQAAQVLTDQVRGILATQATSDGTGSAKVNLFTESVGKRIVVAGNSDMVKRAMELLKGLDVSLGVTTVVYRIRNTNAERIDKLIKGFVEPPNDESSYQTTVDEEGNLLIVRGSEEVHRQIAKLIAELDTVIDTAESPIQFYKLKNASAIDVLYSLLALQEAYGTGGFAGGVPGAFFSPFGGGPGYPGGVFPLAAQGMTQGMGNPSDLAVVPLPLVPDNGIRQPLVQQQQNPLARPTLATGPASNMGGGGESTPTLGSQLAGGMAGGAMASGFGGGGFGGGMGGGVATLPGGARISADVSTNSLIVYAPSSVQPLYAKLIESLDQRRPQVLIEAQIIAVNTTDDFTLGVEVSLGDRTGAKRLFKFTSFGLSEVNRDTGALRIIPGLGFNGTLIDPEVADVVVRALASHRRARVLAAPKILVNDNSTGTLESVTSVPFSSINASQTVSTTSLGGNQQAGTIITVTPHINEDNHLQLDFDVEFSTFSGTANEGLPPPRQIDRVGSSVTIPDGKTVVVGGLKRIGDSYTFSGLPWAEKIPIIRELTSRTDTNKTTLSFFLFIRPMVLRDSRFADLRYLSDKDAVDACIPGDFPVSQPELIR
jgi:general secretion pathway protein D